jgi:repressor LexA
MHVGDYIKQLRTSKGMTQEELGAKIGVQRAAVQKWEAGITQNLKRSTIQMLAKLFEVSPASFFDDDTNIEENSSQIGIPYNPIIHKIPILGRIAAGLPLYAEEHIEGYTYTEHNGGAEYFALKVKGDSMTAAHINDGSMIIVRRQPEVENGQIAVVRVGKEDATVKRFRQDGNIVQLIPQSYNPEHQIQIYDLKTTDIEIIGKVVECKVEF